MGEATCLTFRYRLTSADGMRILLVHSAATEMRAVELKTRKKGEWAEATVDFGESAKGARSDEIHFLLREREAELLVDDVLLYEPGH